MTKLLKPISILLTVSLLLMLAGCAKKSGDHGAALPNETAKVTEPATAEPTAAPTAAPIPEPTATPEPTPDPVIAEAKRLAEQHGLTEEELSGEYALFAEFCEAIESNAFLGPYREFVYRIFPVVAAKKEYLDKDSFLGRLRGLSISMSDLQSGHLGEYFDWSTEILLDQSALEAEPYKLPHTLFHELMHFLDFTLNGDTGRYALLDGEPIRLADMYDHTAEERERMIVCAETGFVTEGGAEVYAAKYLFGAENAYFESCLFLTGLEYIYGSDKLDELFFSRYSDAVFAEMLFEAGYSEERYNDACASLNWFSRFDYYQKPDRVILPADILIDLYEYKLGDGWQNDERFTYILKCICGIADHSHEQAEHAEELSRIVFKNWSSYTDFQHRLMADVEDDVDMLLLPPNALITEAGYRLCCFAQWHDPDTGELIHGTVSYDYDLEEDKLIGYELTDADAFFGKYFDESVFEG